MIVETAFIRGSYSGKIAFVRQTYGQCSLEEAEAASLRQWLDDALERHWNAETPK